MTDVNKKLAFIGLVLVAVSYVIGLPAGYPVAFSVGLGIGAVNCVLIMQIGQKMLAKPGPEGSNEKKSGMMAAVMALKVFAPALAVFIVLIPLNQPVPPVIVGLVVGFGSFIGAVLWSRQSQN